jgi:hypothetical protein
VVLDLNDLLEISDRQGRIHLSNWRTLAAAKWIQAIQEFTCARFRRSWLLHLEFAQRFPENDMMKRMLLALIFAVSSLALLAQGAPPQGAADAPYAVEYYYKVQWGHQQEFLDLFLKNHYPLLKKIVESGRMASVKIETPANHMPEEARWDYRVTIVFKNSTLATTSNPDEDSLIKQLYPDQPTYRREEQRRFEILLAHWDLPVSNITPLPRQ